MMDHASERMAIVKEAESWLRTPYLSNGCIKGIRGGGVDCAMILVAIYGDLGYIPKEFDPRPYAPQWHVHRSEEMYMHYVQKFAKEIHTDPLPGDVVLFKISLAHAHGAIVVDWPNIIHAVGGSHVRRDDVSRQTLGKRALNNVPKRFFSIWG